MVMFSEDDLLPISALQHLLFCERQCALIHIEGAWAENRLTVEGRHLHEKVHGGPDETRHARDGPVRIVRGLPLRSLRLGLAGVADVVEFRAPPDGRGPPRLFPIEYKRGRPKRGDCDRVQLCAQALCLEEMLGVAVPAGAFFYGRTRHRAEVTFDAAGRLHELIAARVTPVVPRQPKCKSCSIAGQCLPQAAIRSSASDYLRRALRAAAADDNTEQPP
jgi:CRISPR-associated exonuclease Cas4